MRPYPKFYITPKGEKAARKGHPWVFGEEVTKVEGRYENGDLVVNFITEIKITESLSQITALSKDALTIK